MFDSVILWGRLGLVWVLVISFASLEVRAQIPGVGSTPTNFGGSEYFVGRIEGKPLIAVNLLDGVRLPGVYHIPVQTNMAQLFSYAGGLTDSAQIESVTIRNNKSGNISNAKYNLNEIMLKNETLPTLQDNDVIHVALSQDSLPRTALWISILASIASIALTADILSRNK